MSSLRNLVVLSAYCASSAEGFSAPSSTLHRGAFGVDVRPSANDIATAPQPMQSDFPPDLYSFNERPKSLSVDDGKMPRSFDFEEARRDINMHGDDSRERIERRRDAKDHVGRMESVGPSNLFRRRETEPMGRFYEHDEERFDRRQEYSQMQPRREGRWWGSSPRRSFHSAYDIDEPHGPLETSGHYLERQDEMWDGPRGPEGEMRREHFNKREIIAYPFSSEGVFMEGGQLLTYPLDYSVEAVEVTLVNNGMPMHATVELWGEESHVKQVSDVYNDDGGARPYSKIVETPGGVNTIAIRNTGPIDHPFEVIVEPVRTMHDFDSEERWHGPMNEPW